MLSSCKKNKKPSKMQKSKNEFLKKSMLKRSLRPNNRLTRMHLLHSKRQIELGKKKKSLKRNKRLLKNR